MAESVAEPAVRQFYKNEEVRASRLKQADRRARPGQCCLFSTTGKTPADFQKRVKPSLQK
jgi:hypothetical protein